MNRRSFIRHASLAAAGNIAGLKPFGFLNAMAQSQSDYKALVCVFLMGGNDGNNMLVPFDNKGYAQYAAARGPLTLTQGSLLQLGSMPGFALHPSLSELRSLVDSGAAALVANVGTLDQPLTRAQYLSGSGAPNALFSHADQQQQWQGFLQSSGQVSGWAGRVADAYTSTFNPSATIPMITSVDGDTLFCDGFKSSPFSVAPGHLSSGACDAGALCSMRLSAAQALLTFDNGLSLVQADNAIAANANRYSATLQDAVSTSQPLKTAFPANNNLATQLQQVAQIMQVRNALSVSRQIFFCGLGGFDTHSSQLTTHAAMLQQLSQAVSAFYQATQELGIQQQVTTFSMSDFGRALQPNSNYGSDHAWGSHHFVLGGAVRGANMYGTFPACILGGPDDADVNGRWIPTTSSAQYGATLASWFGVPISGLSAVFPTLGNFKAPTLGFL
jgi:uncharacterized protein (DUF1501 family)